MGSDMAQPAEHATGDRIQNFIRRRPVIAATIAVLAPPGFAVTCYVYTRLTPGTDEMLFIELAGKAQWIREAVGRNANQYTHALYFDFGFIAAYLVAIASGTALGWSLSLTSTAKRWSLAAFGAVLIAAVCDVGENLALLKVINYHGGDVFAGAAQALAFTKFVFVVPAACVAVVAITTTLWRALTGFRSHTDRIENLVEVLQPPTANDAELDSQADHTEGITHSAWRANTRLPQDRRPPAPVTGICVSGGGIRSATFTLGALDALRPVVKRARYLVSVSGGGYATGALQSALQPRKGPPPGAKKNRPNADGRSRSVAGPKDVFASGSAELNHTRQHGKYLADGAIQWMVALGAVLRGFLVSALILVLTVVVFGRLIGHLYAMLIEEAPIISFWPPLPGVLWAIGGAAVLCFVAWIFSVLLEETKRGRVFEWARNGLAAVAAFIALTGIGLPLLATTSQLILWHLTIPKAAVGSSAFVISYLSVLIAVGKRPEVRKATGKLRAWWASASPQRRSLGATIAVYAGQIIIVAGMLLLLGDVLATARLPLDKSPRYHLPEIALTAILAALLVFFTTRDQVRWSLHRFYRKRLATAFAVRRCRDGGRVWAEAYEYAEQTPLHEYARRHAEFPQVILLCAAHVSSQEMAPPGRKVIPWTMSGDYIGSPMLGWAPSKDLDEAVSKFSKWLQSDMTLQAAQAISGAAIASQMGRMNHPYTRLLTLTNVRLGTWLPNPAYIHALAARSGDPRHRDWWLPRMPKRRYLLTWARELMGTYPADGPLIFVTDGGHYENLGLVELLRHRCRYVCCIDGSGDRRDVPQTLAQAIELAYEELGVTIQLDDPGRLSAGPDGPHPAAPDELLAELRDRLAQDCVITGRIIYPDLGPDLPRQVGRVIVAKAVLTEDTPFDVLAHARCHPSFPNDSTADQWFDFTQFDAYHSLGRHVGAKALISMWTQISALDGKKRRGPLPLSY